MTNYDGVIKLGKAIERVCKKEKIGTMDMIAYLELVKMGVLVEEMIEEKLEVKYPPAK